VAPYDPLNALTGMLCHNAALVTSAISLGLVNVGFGHVADSRIPTASGGSHPEADFTQPTAARPCASGGDLPTHCSAKLYSGRLGWLRIHPKRWVVKNANDPLRFTGLVGTFNQNFERLLLRIAKRRSVADGRVLLETYCPFRALERFRGPYSPAAHHPMLEETGAGSAMAWRFKPAQPLATGRHRPVSHPGHHRCGTSCGRRRGQERLLIEAAGYVRRAPKRSHTAWLTLAQSANFMKPILHSSRGMASA
jgi:hypothetical protein